MRNGPAPARTDELAVVDHDAPRESTVFALPGDRHALVGRVVDVHVVSRRREGVGGVRVVEHDVGVRCPAR